MREQLRTRCGISEDELLWISEAGGNFYEWTYGRPQKGRVFQKKGGTALYLHTTALLTPDRGKETNLQQSRCEI